MSVKLSSYSYLSNYFFLFYIDTISLFIIDYFINFYSISFYWYLIFLVGKQSLCEKSSLKSFNFSINPYIVWSIFYNLLSSY